MSRAELSFDDIGQGEPLVLLHAFPLDRRMWLAQKDELAGSARIIAPDLRGFGRSADLGAPRSIEEHADDVAAVLDKLGIERATIAGLSMGGYVALAVARRHAHRIGRFALADTRSLADSTEGKAARDQNIALLRTEGVAALVERMLPKLLSAGASADVVARVRSLGNSQKPEGLAAALSAMRDRPDSTAVLSTLNVPSTVIVGEADPISPPDEARAMAALLPRAEVEVIPGVGHLSNLEAPAAFTTALRRLLGRK
jgi:pimeloyl-ACP methyl ester carboxylesterase